MRIGVAVLVGVELRVCDDCVGVKEAEYLMEALLLRVAERVGLAGGEGIGEAESVNVCVYRADAGAEPEAVGDAKPVREAGRVTVERVTPDSIADRDGKGE